MRDFFMDMSGWTKAFFAFIFLAMIAIIVGTIAACVIEANEPLSGEIYKLVYTEAHTSLMPMQHSFPNGNGGYTHWTTYQTIYHPESYVVQYRTWSDEENKWLNGDATVPAQMFSQLKIGEHFENTNK